MKEANTKLKKVHNKVNPKDLLKKSYTDSIESELVNKGVTFFSPDNKLNIDLDYLELPKDLTEVSPRSLGKYLNAFTQQKMYIRTLIGWSEVMIEEARREYMIVAIPHYNRVNALKMSEKAKDTEVNNHPEVIEHFNKLRDLQVKKRALEFNLSNLEDAIFLLSREISRRESDFGDESRNYNVGSKH